MSAKKYGRSLGLLTTIVPDTADTNDNEAANRAHYEALIPTSKEFSAFCRKLGVSDQGDPLVVWTRVGMAAYLRHMHQRPAGRHKGIKLRESDRKIIQAVERKMAAHADRLSLAFQQFKKTRIYDPSTIPHPLDFNKALKLELRKLPDGEQEAARKRLTRYWKARLDGNDSLAAFLLKLTARKRAKSTVPAKSRTLNN